jgi:protein-S-isoprenylcysteine O-methyltransferase Ste14
VLPENPLTALLELAGIFLAIWALWTMRSSTLQVTADIAPESVLITNGPYSFVRHPMYSGLLLVVLALLINDFTFPRLIALGIIIADILIQIHYEELLFLKHERHAKDYLHYQKETKKLIPFVF